MRQSTILFLTFTFVLLDAGQSFVLLQSLRHGKPLQAVAGDSLTLFSPCKINLFLRILRKREDGFHDLASLFQAIGFGDDLTLKVLDGTSTSDSFSCNMEGVPTDSSNLVLRALQLMREKTGQNVYFDATLFKNCPAQAGLGGGSANAATAMFGCNELMGKPACQEQVRQLVN
jgi:4-diphosphocytidyl-2-C-methyl-D-erythritol kinase